MAMVLQQTSTFYDGRKPRKLYAVILRDMETGEIAFIEWTSDKGRATPIRSSLREWAKREVSALNACPRIEAGVEGNFYALRYRRPPNMKRVTCCRCGRRFYAYIEPRHPEYENRVCSKCVKKCNG